MKKSKKSQILLGILSALGAAVVSGISIAYAKMSVSQIDPFVLTFLRNSVATFFIFLFIVFKSKTQKKTSISSTDKIILTGLSVITGGVAFALFFFGLSTTGSQTANIINKTLFLWVGIFALITQRSFKKWMIVLYMGLLGAMWFLLPSEFYIGKGMWFVLGATFLWAGEQLIFEKLLRRIPTHLVALTRMGVGSLTLFFIIGMMGKLPILAQLSSSQIQTALVGGGILAGYVGLWLVALRRISAVTTTILLTLSTGVGAFITGTIINISISPSEIASFGITLAVSTMLIFMMIGQEKQARILSS